VRESAAGVDGDDSTTSSQPPSLVR
jgi:hypothetical protein